MFNSLGPDQTVRKRTIAVPLLHDHLVEVGKQLVFQGYAEAGNPFLAHGVTHLAFVTSPRQAPGASWGLLSGLLLESTGQVTTVC